MPLAAPVPMQPGDKVRLPYARAAKEMTADFSDGTLSKITARVAPRGLARDRGGNIDVVVAPADHAPWSAVDALVDRMNADICRASEGFPLRDVSDVPTLSDAGIIPPAAALDAAADGAFGGKHLPTPKLGDSGDKAPTKNHRAGYAGMVLDGHRYTATQFVERVARVGGCLGAGEGGLLVDLLDAYRAQFGRIDADPLPTPVSDA